MEWMGFVCKKLALKLHPTYLATRQLHMVITISQRVMCNWARFVNGLIHEELAMKKKARKVNTFLCGHYISFIVQYCMKTSKANLKKTMFTNVLNSLRQKTIALEDCLVHQSPKELVVQQGERVEALRGENQKERNWSERFVGLLE
jgi:hypothetical protein